MSELVILNDGLQDISITDDTSNIIFDVKRTNNETVNYTISKLSDFSVYRDLISDTIKNSINLDSYYTKEDVNNTVTKELSEYVLKQDIPDLFYTIPGRINMLHPCYANSIGIRKFPPEAALHINDDHFILENSKTVASRSENGKKGSISWDDDNLFVCTDSDNWKKSPLTNVGEKGPRFDVVELKNVESPTNTPSNAGYLFSENGSLKWKGSSGTITTIAPA